MNESQADALMKAVEWYIEAAVVAIANKPWGVPQTSTMTLPDAREQLRKVIRGCCWDDK